MAKIFKRRKLYFEVIFAQREFFLKTLAMYNYRGPTEFKIQSRLIIKPKIIPFPFNMQKLFNQFAQFIKSFVSYTRFESPIIYKASPIFDYADPIIIKVTFSFPTFVSACEKSAHLISQFILEIPFISFPRPKRPCPFLTTTTQKLLK